MTDKLRKKKGDKKKRTFDLYGKASKRSLRMREKQKQTIKKAEKPKHK